MDKSGRKELINIIKNKNKDREKIQYVINKVIEYGGIDYTITKMNAYRDEAFNILHEFEDNEVRKALEELVRFTTDRKY